MIASFYIYITFINYNMKTKKRFRAPNKGKAKDVKVFNIRFSNPKTFENIEKAAQSEKWSVNTLIDHILTEKFGPREKEKA